MKRDGVGPLLPVPTLVPLADVVRGISGLGKLPIVKLDGKGHRVQCQDPPDQETMTPPKPTLTGNIS